MLGFLEKCVADTFPYVVFVILQIEESRDMISGEAYWGLQRSTLRRM